MYFKRLELFGFKSFAERTRLDFEPGITAIVGPNGCGKSNIVDSIKWVLGEQSARVLRGGKMEDVIFNGTDGKEPVSYAEVSLTLSNQDRILPIEYDEVTVTRRLYRSGESEYLLNRTPVRLRDINELFMGTGIGTRAYSLIEQGRIDQVLSSRPEERREVFEEASGITRYKSKRKEALRRLEDTEQNLIRINDIIQEVKRQINSIERQARKAERYKERYEELKGLELTSSRIELEILKQRLSEFSGHLDRHRLKEAALNSELQKLANELSGLNSQRSEIENKRMEFKSGIIGIDSNISKYTDKLSLDRERIEELQKRRVDLESEIEKNQENIASQRKEVEGLREKLGLLEKEDTEKSSLLSEREKRLEEISKKMREYETSISTSKANVIDIAAKISRLRNQIARVSTTLSTHDARLKRLETERRTVREEKEGLDIKLGELKQEIGFIEKEMASLKDEKGRISQVISGLNTKIEGLSEESKEMQAVLATNKSRADILREAKAKYEGFSSGVRSILGKTEENQHAIEGVRDVLVNLLSVKNGYEIAIETALGKNLESIVVDKMESAERAIGFLREHSCGRASFIDSGSFNNLSERGEDVVVDDGRILGRAIDFVNAGEENKNILAHLLKDIFIVRDMEGAKGVLRDLCSSSRLDRGPTGYIFVTLTGEFVANGLIAGGNIANEEATLINRDSKIKELSRTISELEIRLQQTEEERLKDEEQRQELERKSEGISAALNEKEILLANAKSRCTNIEENIKGVIDEISLVVLEIDEVTAEVERFKEEEVALKEQLSEAEKEARLNEETIRNNENLISEYTKEKERLVIETVEQRTELGTLEDRKEGFSSTLNILESSLRDAEFASSSRRSETEHSVKKVEELNVEIAGLQRNIEALSRERVTNNEKLSGVEKAYSGITEKIGHADLTSKQLKKEIDELTSLLHEADLKRAETNYSADNLRQRIKDVYKVDLGEVGLADGWPDIDLSQLKNEMEEKRTRLDSIGTVNLVAIEEHTELQDRYTFLTNQRDDLLKAKDSLLKAIARINKTTKELFIETFRNIQVEFRGFFKMLFGGGDGELMLLDEDKVLESGIEIVVRPPGKKLQNVSLLSGGEKALTAIALIFAIFKVKPSPFCILDEIDASLDESNVDRFSRSLDMFTHASQFIVITHNKKTIDMASVMYGITMQESGVSKVISVRFSDTKKENAVNKA